MASTHRHVGTERHSIAARRRYGRKPHDLGAESERYDQRIQRSTARWPDMMGFLRSATMLGIVLFAYPVALYTLFKVVAIGLQIDKPHFIEACLQLLCLGPFVVVATLTLIAYSVSHPKGNADRAEVFSATITLAAMVVILVLVLGIYADVLEIWRFPYRIVTTRPGREYGFAGVVVPALFFWLGIASAFTGGLLSNALGARIHAHRASQVAGRD